jgi:hypothetical protein
MTPRRHQLWLLALFVCGFFAATIGALALIVFAVLDWKRAADMAFGSVLLGVFAFCGSLLAAKDSQR